MSFEAGTPQELLDTSAQLVNSPEAEFEMREFSDLPLTEEGGIAFRLYRDTSSKKNHIQIKHDLDFHASRARLLGVDMPLIQNSVCMAWEQPGTPPLMALRRPFGGQETQETVAKLIENGLLTDPELADRVDSIRGTLEKFAVVHALEDAADPDLRQEAGQVLVSESNDRLAACGEVGAHTSIIRLERPEDAAYLEVRQQRIPSSDATVTNVRLKHGDKWVAYEESHPLLSSSERKPATVKVYDDPQSQGAPTKRMINEQITLDLGEGATPTEYLREMLARGRQVPLPTLQSEHSLDEAAEFITGVVTVMKDAAEESGGWIVVDRSPW